jgi:hypothetical protein
MKKGLGLIWFLFATLIAFAQKQEAPLVQFTGIINNADSTNVPVPYVSIVNSKNKNFAIYSNYKGYFSFVVHEKDTIRFSCVGYAPIIIQIPEKVANKSYTRQILLKPQMSDLPASRNFPWANEEEFTKEFLSTKLADDDLENARKNLSNANISSSLRTLPRDGLESGMTFQDFHYGAVNGHSTVNSLLNPFNWGMLIKEIAEGDKSRNADKQTTTPATSTTTSN